MSRHIRIRCPVCGMLGWQSRLDKNHRFEILFQDIRGKGRGRGFSHTYSHPESEEGVWLLKLAMIEKMEAIIEELKAELREEKSEAWMGKIQRREYAEARQVLSTYHAGFSEVLASVETLTGAVCVVPAPVPSLLKLETPMVALIPALLGRSVQRAVKSLPVSSVPVGVKSGLGRSFREDVKSERYDDDGLENATPTVDSDVALSFSGVGRSISEGGGSGSGSSLFAGGPVGGSVSSLSSGRIGGKGKSKKGNYDEKVTTESKLVAE